MKGGFGFVLDRDQLVSRLLVVPGKAGQSDLMLRVQQGEMPPPSRKLRVISGRHEPWPDCQVARQAASWSPDPLGQMQMTDGMPVSGTF